MFANAGLENICQCCFGKCLPILVWKIFGNAGLGNVCQYWVGRYLPILVWGILNLHLLVWEMFANTGFGKYLPVLVWNIFAKAGLGNVCQCWYRICLPMLVLEIFVHLLFACLY